MYDFTEISVRKELEKIVKNDALIQIGYPINETTGPDNLYKMSYQKLNHAFPDLSLIHI